MQWVVGRGLKTNPDAASQCRSTNSLICKLFINTGIKVTQERTWMKYTSLDHIFWPAINLIPVYAGVKRWAGKSGKHSTSSSNRFLSISEPFSYNSHDSSVAFKQWSEVEFGVQSPLAVLQGYLASRCDKQCTHCTMYEYNKITMFNFVYFRILICHFNKGDTIPRLAVGFTLLCFE
jgi:hypothetical protein